MTTKTINGTGGNDAISIADNGAGFDVTLNVNTTGPFVDDTIIVNGGSGNDSINLSALTSASGVTSVSIKGGAGNDILTGSQLSDIFLVSGSSAVSYTHLTSHSTYFSASLRKIILWRDHARSLTLM